MEMDDLRENFRQVIRKWENQSGVLRKALLSQVVGEDGLSRVTLREVQSLTGITDEDRVKALLASLVPLPEGSDFTQETVLEFNPKELSEEEL